MFLVVAWGLLFDDLVRLVENTYYLDHDAIDTAVVVNNLKRKI